MRLQMLQGVAGDAGGCRLCMRLQVLQGVAGAAWGARRGRLTWKSGAWVGASRTPVSKSSRALTVRPSALAARARAWDSMGLAAWVHGVGSLVAQGCGCSAMACAFHVRGTAAA